MTWNDEIVEDVRRVRQENAEKFNYDISAICADVRRRQAEEKRKIIVSIEQSEPEEELTDALQIA
ncbi:MAG: hypothetical protein ACK5NT_00825 [Pyrinomonadaceae bacterium]